MKRVMIALIACTFLFACSKDDKNDTTPDPYNNDESYQPSADVILEEPVMYTNNSVIHDQALIADYVARIGYQRPALTGNDLSSYSLTFTGGNNVLLGNIKATIINKNDSLMLIEAVDYANEETRKKSVCDTLLDLLPKNGPLAECPTYYTNPCKYKKKYPVLISGGNYYIPYLVTSVSTTTYRPIFGVMMEFRDKSYFAGPSMVFNDSLLTYLSNNTMLTYYDDVLSREITTQRYDTMVVQSVRRLLKKQ
jgi:hypothetical protein